MATNTFNAPRAEMRGIRDGFTNAANAIRGDNRYSQEGVKAALASALLDARDRAAALRDAYQLETGGTQHTLQQKLFGLPAGDRENPAAIVAYRDAADRAAKIERAEDAMTALDRALLHQDRGLARAIASHAHDRKWYAVVDAYAAAVGQQDTLDELRALPTAGQARFAITALFSISVPHELRGLGDRDLADLAGR